MSSLFVFSNYDKQGARCYAREKLAILQQKKQKVIERRLRVKQRMKNIVHHWMNLKLSTMFT